MSKNKIINFILAAMFLVFAFLQLNDPDPVIWILIYGIMSIVSIMAMFDIYHRPSLVILASLYAIYSLVYFPGLQVWWGQEDKAQLFDNVAKMDHPFIEESREFLGLAICIFVIIVYLIKSRKSNAYLPDKM